MSEKPYKIIAWCAVSTPAQAADEKESLPRQYSDIFEEPLFKNAIVVDKINIPGNSRKFTNFDRFVLDCLKHGISDPERMYAHLENQDFDVLVVKDSTRLGREWGIFGELVQLIINSGARIYVMRGWGWVDKVNVDQFIMVNGFASKKQITDLAAHREQGMSGKALRGKRTGNAAPRFWIEVDDEKLIPDPDTRHVVNDAALLFLEGVAYQSFEQEMYARFGYSQPGTNHRYGYYTFRNLFCDPRSYGHAVWGNRRVKPQKNRVRLPIGLWIVDPVAYLPPSKVDIKPNVLQPQWEGELLDLVKQEFTRRHTIIKGSTRPQMSYPLSGLLHCAVCGNRMVVSRVDHNGIPYVYYICMSKHRHRRYPDAYPNCENKKPIPERIVKDLINNLLEQAIQANDINRLFGIPKQDNNTLRIIGIKKEIADLDADSARLRDHLRKMTQHDAQHTIRTLGEIDDQRQQKQAILTRLEIDAQTSDRVVRMQNKTFEEIKRQKLLDFWNMPPTQINQRLLSLFGNWRIHIRNGKPDGMAKLPS